MSVENIKLAASIVSSFCLAVLVPIAGWSLKTQIDFQQQTHARLSVIEAWIGEGPRYTRDHAKEDLGHVVEKVNDHELRIRGLELKQP